MKPGFSEVHLRPVTAENYRALCHLSEELTDEQRQALPDNVYSIAESFLGETAWIRAVYVNDELAGLVFAHFGVDYSLGNEHDIPYLKRIMVGKDFQGKGIGKAAAHLVFKFAKNLGCKSMLGSCTHSEYEKGKARWLESTGYRNTGKRDVEDEHLFIIDLESWNPES